MMPRPRSRHGTADAQDALMERVKKTLGDKRFAEYISAPDPDIAL